MKLFDAIFGPGFRPRTLKDAAFPPEGRSVWRTLFNAPRVLLSRRRQAVRQHLTQDQRRHLIRTLAIWGAIYSLPLILGLAILASVPTYGDVYIAPGCAAVYAGFLLSYTSLRERDRLIDELEAENKEQEGR